MSKWIQGCVYTTTPFSIGTLFNIFPSTEHFEQGVEQKVSRGVFINSNNSRHDSHLNGLGIASIWLQSVVTLWLKCFGNKFKIAIAYIAKVLAWPAVRAEDVNALQNYSLFLRSCCNVMEKLQYVRELDIPSNIRAVMPKLPYKLRERWRIYWKHLIKEHFVPFIEKHI